MIFLVFLFYFRDIGYIYFNVFVLVPKYRFRRIYHGNFRKRGENIQKSRHLASIFLTLQCSCLPLDFKSSPNQENWVCKCFDRQFAGRSILSCITRDFYFNVQHQDFRNRYAQKMKSSTARIWCGVFCGEASATIQEVEMEPKLHLPRARRYWATNRSIFSMFHDTCAISSRCKRPKYVSWSMNNHHQQSVVKWWWINAFPWGLKTGFPPLYATSEMGSQTHSPRVGGDLLIAREVQHCCAKHYDWR